MFTPDRYVLHDMPYGGTIPSAKRVGVPLIYFGGTCSPIGGGGGGSYVKRSFSHIP